MTMDRNYTEQFFIPQSREPTTVKALD